MIILRKFTFWLALLGVAAAVSLVVRMRAGITQPIPAAPITPPAKPFAKAIGASGLIEAARENTAVGAPAAGLLASLQTQVWAKVKKGDVLFSLDDRDLRAALITQRAQIAVSEAQLQRTRDQLTRLQSVDDPRAVAADDLRNRQNDVAVAEAQVTAAKAAVAQTEALLERLVVRAPIDGTVLQVNVRVGEFVSPTSPTPPVVLGDVEQLQVRADVDEQIAPRVRAGSQAVGYIKGDSTHPISLQFVRIEPFVIPKKSLTGASAERVDTRVLQIIYRFPPQERPIYVGQQMDLYLEE